MKKDRQIGVDELRLELAEAIDVIKSRYIAFDKLLALAEGSRLGMPAFLQSPAGQAIFTQAVLALTKDEVISPVGKQTNAKGLHLKYRIHPKLMSKSLDVRNQMVQAISPPASLEYYLRHPQDYLADKPIIDVINRFLKQRPSNMITLNERAYELFGDEKFFKGAGKQRSRGETVLKRLGLNYQDLACLETAEPFFSFQNREFHTQVNRTIYIVENKDTFWSMKRVLMDSPSKLPMDMLIYGEGKKILRSFQFVDQYHVNLQSDQFYYFGDLDQEGIAIYYELVARYSEYTICPFYQGYQAIAEIGLKRGVVNTPTMQKINADTIDTFCASFTPALSRELCETLKEGCYIPQEALSAAEMKKRFGCVTR